jgi:CheY-like chemotaxis protein
LKGEGFEVETVSNGVAAIRRLAVLHPVVILADVSMPGRDGYEVCEFIKKSPELCLVPVLLLASDMEPYDDARGAQVGADGIIKKPFERGEFVGIVEKFAEQFEATAPTVVVPVVAPTSPMDIPEFAAYGHTQDEAPTLVQHTPDLSSAPEGVGLNGAAEDDTLTEIPRAELEPAPEIAEKPAQAPEFPEITPPSDAPSSSIGEVPLVVEESLSPGVFDTPLCPSATTTPLLEHGEEASPEPVFIDEQSTAPLTSPSAGSDIETPIFRAPIDIAEPLWKDETVASPPPPTPAVPSPFDIQLEHEPPVAAVDIPMEQPSQPAPFLTGMTATSLDSFSLDDATAGQVRFAMEGVGTNPEDVELSALEPESSAADAAAEQTPPVAPAKPEAAAGSSGVAGVGIVPNTIGLAAPEPQPAFSEAPARQIAAEETAPTQVLPEVIPPEAVTPGTDPESITIETPAPEVSPQQEAVGSQVVPEVVPPEAATPEPAPETVSVEAPILEAASAESAPTEFLPEVIPAEATAPQPFSEPTSSDTSGPEEAFAGNSPTEIPQEVIPAEAATMEPAPQAVSTETLASEPASVETAPTQFLPDVVPAEAMAAEPAPEAFFTATPTLEPTPSGVTGTEPSPEAVSTETVRAETVPTELAGPEPEIVAADVAPPEVMPEVAAPEAQADLGASPAVFDWGLFYTVVHKTVVKMSPPALPAEMVEELARRLADEIATEICSESNPPQT